MRSKRILAFVAVVLVASGPALALTHHENFDDAKWNIMVLTQYVKDTLQALNRTLESCLVLDVEKALSWSGDYSSKVVAAKRTLDRIPNDVGSYPYLERYVIGLARIEVNLTLTVEALAGAVSASTTIRTYTDPVWTMDSMREDLTRLDTAFADLYHDLDIFMGSSLALVKDIEQFKGSGQNVTYQVALAGELKDLRVNISADLGTPWDLLALILVHPMWHWAIGTRSLLAQTPPGTELQRCSSILSSVFPLLTGGMRAPVGKAVKSLSEASSELRSFGGNQSVFLEGLLVLEGGTGDLSERVHRFEMCRAALSSMDDSLLNMEGDLSSLSAYDNGSVGEGLSLLGELLKDYRRRLGDVDLLEGRLENIIGMVSATFWSNVILLDADGDGALSVDEVSNLNLGTRPGELAGAVKAEWETMKDELVQMPEWLLAQVNDAIAPLDELVRGGLEFTSSHYELVRGLGRISGTARSGHNLDAVGPCFSHISFMEATLSDLTPLLGSLEAEGLDAQGSYLIPLEGMVRLYKDFLLGFISELNETFISLKVRPEVLPYDLTARYSVVVLDRDVHGVIGLAEGLKVAIGMDGVDIATLTVRGGMAHGKLLVHRELSLGEHLVSAECLDSTGKELNASDNLVVRRLNTILTLSAPRTVLTAGESGTVRVRAIDELFRPYSGTVLLGGTSVSVSGTGLFQVSLEGFGWHVLEGTIPRTDHFEGAEASMVLLVVLEPVVKLITDKTSLYVDEVLMVNVSVISGEGYLHLLLDGSPLELGRMGNGTWRVLEVKAKDLGPGRHMLQARLTTTVVWALNGWSDPVEVEVLVREPKRPKPEVQNGTVPWNQEVPPNPWEEILPDWEWLRSPVLRAVLIAIVTLTLIVVGAFLVIRLRKGRGGKGKRVLPKVHVKRRTKTAPDKVPPGPLTNEEGATAEVPPAIVPSGLRTVDDPQREQLVRMYLELIDGSSDLGLRRSMTHNEAMAKLRELGLDDEVAQRLGRTFERSIYQRGAPVKDELEGFGRDKGVASRFVSRLLDRLGPVLGRRGEGG